MAWIWRCRPASSSSSSCRVTDHVSAPEPLLGIDLGTQSVKVAAVLEGDIVASASRPYPVESPEPGWAQTDPEAWLSAIDSAVSDVIGAVGMPGAVSFSGQMHGLVATDDELTALTPGIVWADGRSAPQADRMSKRLGPSTLARLGSTAFPGFLGPTSAWLAEHEPKLLQRTRWLLSPKDFIRARWTGEIATEVSDASGTLLFNVVEGHWDAEATAACGIDPDTLPPLVPSAAPAGVVSRGPLSGVPVATGGADTACVIHGLGIESGAGFLGLGSGTQIVSVCAQPDIDETLRTHTFSTVGIAGDGWYRLAAVQSGGVVLNRVLSWLAVSERDISTALAEGVRSDDPFFLPFLTGERTPYLSPDLRGSWTNLSLATDRAALLRSVLEGMAFTATVAVGALADVMPRSPLPVVGGGSRDRPYLQLISDLTGLELAPLPGCDAAVVGAARLAAQMRGESIPGLPVSGDPRDVVSPRKSANGTERFDRWRHLVDVTLGL